jgi:hypothetical protein
MWFEIDFNKLVITLLPNELRKPKLVAYLQCLIFPISKIYNTWRKYRSDNLYKIEHNAQVCYFRKALNDRFDPSLRRIYITGGHKYERLYIYTTGENRPLYIGQIFLNRTEDYADTGVDFIVYVPGSIIDTQFFELKALIEFYRLGGKRYKIESI